ncbi:MAG TPA: alpha/beta fold hydrolase [Steroidobacteraceae bacterium]|nr:alpha/beta fold hydrolase [Steroidobacteraceae bacterium]
MSKRERVGLIFGTVIAAAVLSSLTSVAGGQSSEPSSDEYCGNYRLDNDHQIGIDRFIMDGGERVLLFSDYESGVVRRMFSDGASQFVVGPGFNQGGPAELQLDVVRAHDEVTGMTIRTPDGKSERAEKVPLRTEAVSFEGDQATLAGTLIVPATKGRRPAVVLLHGSGPLTRYSFGPYPHFFTSLGLAVLIYDKRETGSSTGIRTDASSGANMRATFYPDELADDALAALRYLQKRADIDPHRIGFWGSSEGGMLATQVAARSNDVAFAIDSSGFMGPLWQTLRYQVITILRSQGVSDEGIEKELALVDLWFDVARTGKGWDELQQRKKEVVRASGSWFYQSRDKQSLRELRWEWDHMLSFDPLRALANVHCPVLGVFGELDPYTDASAASKDMRRVLSEAGHHDFMIKIFPHAGHSLSLMPEKARMAPGVFETLGRWLRNHGMAEPSQAL